MISPAKLSAGFLVAIILVGILSFVVGANQFQTKTTTSTTTSIYTTTSTLTVTREFTKSYLQGVGVQVLTVSANLTRIGDTGNYSLVFIVRWKNTSNGSFYYIGGCESPLRASIIQSSIAKVSVGSAPPCDLTAGPVALGPGDNASSTDPGPWDYKSYIVTGHGRIDANLTLGWWVGPCNPIPMCASGYHLEIFQSFQI